MGFHKNLKLSLVDAFFFSIMVGAGETYISAFGLNQGMSQVMAGWLSTLPMVMGALIQMITPWGVATLGSVRRWVVGATALQASSFLPLLYFSIEKVESHWILFLIVGVYWGAGYAATPSWNFWMRHLVPTQESEHFFSWRTRLTQLGQFLGVVGGGVALHNSIHIGPFTSVFSLLFLLAFTSRASSSLIMSFQDDPTLTPARSSPLAALKELFSRSNSDSDSSSGSGFALGSPLGPVRTSGSGSGLNQHRSLLGFLFCFYFFVTVTSPFVAPFFLKQVGMNYGQYMASVGLFLLAKMALLPFARSWIERWGLQRCFLVSAAGLAPLPGLFLLFHDFWTIQIVQILSGMCWGVFDLCLALIFFGRIDQNHKVQVLTLYNLLHASAVFLGSVAGGLWLKGLSESYGGYMQVFLWGGLLRLVAVLLFWRRNLAR